jgi:aspartate aminotransferase-like enzyme
MGHVKLHIPGPVEVSEKTFKAFCSPMIGHRGQGFKDLYAQIQPQLQSLLSTRQLVYISTSSAWGVMEGAIRNLVSRKVLNCMCGAFSDKWLDVAKRCGKAAEALQVPWGSPILAEEVDKRLATGQFDALTLIHNETSTGVMSPLAEIAALKQKYPDVMFIVDSVSSMTRCPSNLTNLGSSSPGRDTATPAPGCGPSAHGFGQRQSPDRGYYLILEFGKRLQSTSHAEYRTRLP